MIVNNIDARMTFNGECELLLTLPKYERQNVSNLLEEHKNKADKPWEAVISVKRKRRSLDANAYMWVLCDKIADKLGATKEQIYREAIRAVGVFDALLLRRDAVESFVDMWNKQGVGAYAEVIYKSKAMAGVHAYRGSSLYDTKQMARLIDHIVEEAKEQGIETMSPTELERLVKLWK